MADNLDLVMGGIAAGAQGLGQFAEQHRRLSPAVNEYLQAVLDGRMSGKQAAILARMPQGAASGGSPSIAEPQVYPGQGQVPAPGASPMPMSAPPSVSAGAAPAPQMSGPSIADRAPARSASPNLGQVGDFFNIGAKQGQFTAQDLHDFNSVAQSESALKPRGQSDELRWAIEMLREGGRNSRHGADIDEKQAGREQNRGQFDEMMTYRYKALTQDWNKFLQQEEGKMQRLHEHNSSDQRIALINNRTGEIKNLVDNITRLTNSINSLLQDPANAALRQKFEQERAQRLLELNARMQEVDQDYFPELTGGQGGQKKTPPTQGPGATGGGQSSRTKTTTKSKGKAPSPAAQEWLSKHRGEE